MGEVFPNQSYGQRIYKHRELPILVGGEFDFFRCIIFDECFYDKTVSMLHAGNLRIRNGNNRYSSIFPYEKVSYWADSASTARAEVKFHAKSNNLITFWAYDDATSTFPTTTDDEPLYIIDGRQFGFDEILWKDENNIALNKNEKEIISLIVQEEPDCLAYSSKRHNGGVNYLFFEKGFRKLSLRQVRLRLGNRNAKNTNSIYCAGGCDYIPYIEGYGYFFSSVAKVGFDKSYLQSREYLSRKNALSQSYRRYSEAMKHDQT